MPSRKNPDRAAVATGPGAVIVVFNLPVPDDHRVWAEALALRDAGFRVAVVCPSIRDARPGRRRIDGVEIRCFRSFEGEGRLATIFEGAWTTFAAGREARRALAELRGAPRALQVCNPPDLAFGLLRRARRRGVRTLYDQHDVVPLLASSRPSFRKLAPFFLACERRTVAAADAILTPSIEQADRLRELYGREAVIVRTAPVESSASAEAETDAGRGDGEGHEIVLGYLGVIGEQDGVGDLIEAVHALKAKGRNGFRVDLAGDGPALPAVRARTAELGLEDVVRIRGWLGRDQIDRFFRGIDAMLVPDPDIEFNHYCAMNKVTHAMARAIPVVLRPLRENARLVAGAGFVAEDMGLPAFTAAIERFLDASVAEREAQGARLRKTFEAELAWEASSARYVAAYRSAL
ncbi:glycosyltransferase [Actinospica robiniae]|uniref:glycosyltransferase n=1 Tax=Actinospica robiniae TaxID=304901 RepID=UPI000429F274|nr:glycosyltransferase [Actinospica robiniae]